MDQQEYAVKKTVHKVSTQEEGKLSEELNRMLNEVRLVAAIRDPHILRYYNSWVELTFRQDSSVDSDNEDSLPVSSIKCE